MTRRSTGGLVTVRPRTRTTDVFCVLRPELEALRSGYSSVYAVFLGLVFGVFVAVLVSLLTIELGVNRPYFVATALAFALPSGFFTILVVRDFRRANRLVETITRRDARQGVRRS